MPMNPRAVVLPANSQQNIHQKAGGPSKNYVSRRPGEVFVLKSFSSLQRSTQLYLCKTSTAVFRDGGAGESSGVECFARTSTSRGFDTKSGFDSRSAWHRRVAGQCEKVVEKGLLGWKFHVAWHWGVDVRQGVSACVMCPRTGIKWKLFRVQMFWCFFSGTQRNRSYALQYVQLCQFFAKWEEPWCCRPTALSLC